MSYHFAVTIVGYLSLGAAIVLPPNHFARAISDATCRHSATLIYGSPAHYAWLAECEPPTALPSLRLRISTTAALDPRAAEKFYRRFNLPVTQALGIIEVGLPFINVDFAVGRNSAVGRVLPAYRLQMADVGLGDGFKEILLGGGGFLDAYYRPWRDGAAEIMPDGWFHTGDVGELDADGCLFLRGRTKDVISVLGMKFFPQEVEAVLLSHPAVQGACVLAPATSGWVKSPLRGSWPKPTRMDIVRPTNCWITAASGWHRTRCPSRSNLSQHCRAPPAAKCCTARSTRNARVLKAIRRAPWRPRTGCRSATLECGRSRLVGREPFAARPRGSRL